MVNNRKVYILVIPSNNYMKHKICISVDEKTLLDIKENVRNGIFRNKSHAFEYAVKKVMEK